MLTDASKVQEYAKVYCDKHKATDGYAAGPPMKVTITRKMLRTWLANVGLGSTTCVCMLCGSTSTPLSIHDAQVCHDRARASGGTEEVANLVVGHRRCNSEQGTESVAEYQQNHLRQGTITQPTAHMEVHLRPLPEAIIHDVVVKMVGLKVSPQSLEERVMDLLKTQEDGPCS